jgi:hypothetical protein
MALALTTCVRNEAEALPDWLAYHRRLGVDRVYVYLDRCHDGSAEEVRSHPGATAIPADAPDDLVWLTDHQNRCAADALARAAADGCDWLLHLDVDELAWGGPPLAPGPDPDDGLLPLLLADLPDEVDAVRLLPLEVVPERALAHQPHWQFAHVQHPGVLARDMLDPTTGKVVHLERLLAHPRGKVLVRTSSPVHPIDAHSWSRDGSPVKEVHRGWHLHEVTTSPQQWRTKYAKLAFEPDRWPAGNTIAFPKQAWKDAAVQMTDAEVERYWREWVAVGPEAVDQAVAAGVIGVNRAAQAVLASVGRAPALDVHRPAP